MHVAKCDEMEKIRIVNLASHARFYFWFHDKRKFQIVELDGVAYQPKEVDMMEISSGQRASILVKGRNLNQKCAWTYVSIEKPVLPSEADLNLDRCRAGSKSHTWHS